MLLLAVCAPAAERSQPPKYVAHGGGTYHGHLATNCRQALDASAATGFELVEVDLCWTSDDQLVLVHDWNETLARVYSTGPGTRTREEFLALEAVGELEQLDLAGLVAWMGDHPAIDIVTDAKSENLRALRRIAARHPGLVPRFVPQVHSGADAAAAEALGFERIILTLYTSPASDDEVVGIASRAGLWAVTMPAERAEGPLPARLAAHGVFSYAHTINEHTTVSRLMDGGIGGVYTDLLSPALDEQHANAQGDDWSRVAEGESGLDRSVLLLDLLDALGPRSATLTARPAAGSSRTGEAVVVGWGPDGRELGRWTAPLSRPTGLVEAYDELPAWLSAPPDVELHVAWRIHDRPSLERDSTTMAARGVAWGGTVGGLAGARLTILNPTDRPQQVAVDGIGWSQRLRPRSLADCIVPLGDGERSTLRVTGQALVVQLLRADAMLSDVR